MYQVLRISDGSRSYQFLYEHVNTDTCRVYIPDYRPEVFGYRLSYMLSTYDFHDAVTEFPIDIADAMPCVPFNYENHSYCMYVELTGTFNRYVCFEALESGVPSTSFTSAQAANIVIPHNEIQAFLSWEGVNGITVKMQCTSQQDLAHIFGAYPAYSSSYPGVDPLVFGATYECAIMDEDNVYATMTEQWPADYIGKPVDEVHFFDAWQIMYNMPQEMRERTDLRFVGLTRYKLYKPRTGVQLMEWTVRSNSLQITQEMWACLDGVYDDIISIETMNIQKPRIVNQTVQNVVTMTAQTDSKANVVQPVFFRVRELASIVVHPEVTENICINLDSYKSQTDRFMIKIEGTIFQEIGRTEYGVIFKVYGNMLPGKQANGIYYVLDSNAELITTGKYKYEV